MTNIHVVTQPSSEFLDRQAALAGHYSLERKFGRGGMAIVLMLSACAAQPADDPASAAVEFISLARAGKCQDAFAHYTSASQQNLRAFSNKLKENTPYETDANEAYRLHCHVLAAYLPKTVTVAGESRDGDTTYLSAIMRTGSRFPIPFFSDPIKETPVKLAVAREAGEWKMVAPHVQVEDPHRHELKVGKFKVEWPRRSHTDVRGFSVHGVMSVTPEAVEAVMLDFERWPDWMPTVQEVRVLTQPEDTARLRKHLVYVRHAARDGVDGVDFVIEFTNNARTQDRGNRAFTGSWRAMTHAQAVPPHTERGTVWGVSFSARIETDPRKPGTQVRFGYAALPAEWPAELRGVVFEPEQAGHLLAAWEREAVKRSPSLKP